MKRVPTPRPERRVLHRTLRALSSPRRTALRLDGRVATIVLVVVGRLAQRLGPAA